MTLKIKWFEELGIFPKTVIEIAVIVLSAWILSRLIRYFLEIYLKHKKKEQVAVTSIKFFKNAISFIIYSIAFIFIIFSVPALKEQARYIFSGAGILAAIIGFAAQAAVSNLVAGVFIVAFKPFRVGDYIRLDEKRMGIVEDITLRHTVINNFENKRLIIPNSVISTESVLNNTIEDSYVLSFNDFMIGLYADIDKARSIIQEEALKQKYVIDRRSHDDILNNKAQVQVRVIQITDSGIRLRAYIWIDEPLREFRLKCALAEAIHKRFIKENIAMPITLRSIVKTETR